MIVSALKVEIDKKIYEKNVDNVKSISVNVDKRLVEIKFNKNGTWDYKIIFLEKHDSIKIKIEEIKKQMDFIDV